MKWIWKRVHKKIRANILTDNLFCDSGSCPQIGPPISEGVLMSELAPSSGKWTLKFDADREKPLSIERKALTGGVERKSIFTESFLDDLLKSVNDSDTDVSAVNNSSHSEGRGS